MNCEKDKLLIESIINPFEILCATGWCSSEHNFMKLLQEKGVFFKPRVIELSRKKKIKLKSGKTKIKTEILKMIEMDVTRTIRSFLALPGMIDAIVDQHKEIQASAKLCHFTKGKLWEKIVSNYPQSDDTLYIPLFAFMDAYVPLNALSKHGQAYKVFNGFNEAASIFVRSTK